MNSFGFIDDKEILFKGFACDQQIFFAPN